MKIKRLTLHNYRSYNDQTFEFVDGLNVLSGEGGSGKSVVLKGIKFVTENDQNGNPISESILDDKGKIKKKESCYVEIETFNGDVIRRERTRTSNIYILNGEEMGLENSGKAVPEKILRILNLSEVNIASQFESHFLLSQNPSAIAQSLNKLVDLEIIDKSIKNVNKLVKDIRKKKKDSDIQIREYEEQIDGFSYIEAMEKDIEEIEKLQEEENKHLNSQKELIDIKEVLSTFEKDLITIKETTKYLEEVEKVDALFNSVKDIINKKSDLSSYRDGLNISNAALIEANKALSFQSDIQTLLSLKDAIDKATDRYNSLDTLSDTITMNNKELKSLNSKEYEEKVKEILDIMKKYDSIKERDKELTKLVNKIESNEESLEGIKLSISNEFEKIKGLECPMCGNVVKDLKEVC